MRSGGTVQRSSFTSDQPRLTTQASLTTEGSLATHAPFGTHADLAGQPDAKPATSSTGNGTARLFTDAAAESSTRTTIDASLTTKAGTTTETSPDLSPKTNPASKTETSLSACAKRRAETGPMAKLTPTRPKPRPELTWTRSEARPKVTRTRPKARPELTPTRPKSTPTWPELTPTRSATGTGFARTPTRSVPAETGLPTIPPRAPIPAVDEWGKGLTHQRAAVLRHRRNEVRPVAVLVGQNLLQAADRVATEIHTRHGSRRRG
jgi:hypothetical protein